MLKQDSKLHKALLINAGLTLLIIGFWMGLAPNGFYGANGIDIAGNINLMNELRAPGAMFITMGLFITAGAFFKDLSYSSTVIASILYLSYGFGRIFSFTVDGIPNEGLVIAAAIELIFGFACALSWLSIRYARVTEKAVVDG